MHNFANKKVSFSVFGRIYCREGPKRRNPQVKQLFKIIIIISKKNFLPIQNIYI